MKRNIFRWLFLLSFLPYILIIIVALYHAFFGYDVYTWILPTYVKTLYGLEAFTEVLILFGLSFTFIPVLPLCAIYQIIYLIIYIIKKGKWNKGNI